MPLLSARLMVPVAVVVVAWGGVHLLTSHNPAVMPAVWPAAPSTPSATSGGSANGPRVATAPTTSPSPLTGAEVPILPGALQQLNRNTRDTAVGLWALVQQLEGAVRAHLQQILQQLEPGR
jgi:hypothetical protein